MPELILVYDGTSNPPFSSQHLNKERISGQYSSCIVVLLGDHTFDVIGSLESVHYFIDLKVKSSFLQFTDAVSIEKADYETCWTLVSM